MKKTTVALSLLLTSLAVALAFVVACGDAMPKPPSMPDPAAAAGGVPGAPGSATPASSGSAAPAKK